MIEQQAVAWMYDGPEGEHYIREHRDISHNWLAKNGWIETPLYATPSRVEAGELLDEALGALAGTAAILNSLWGKPDIPPQGAAKLDQVLAKARAVLAKASGAQS